jgi:hypothetical protein
MNCKNPFDRTAESKLARLIARISFAIHGFWIPAFPAGMTAHANAYTRELGGH